ncbi:MAG: M56 family metallopeptidase, partial [Planctomycetaceae bacterium]
MTALILTINELSAAVLPALWRASWQGGLALLLVFTLCRAMRRMPAQIQCWLWRLAYVKLLIAGLWLAPVELHVLPPVEEARFVSSDVHAVPMSATDSADVARPLEETEFAAPAINSPTDVDAARPSPVHSAGPVLSWRGWLLLAWITGVFASVANLVRQWSRVRGMVSRASLVTTGPVLQRIRAHGEALRIKCPPAVSTSPDAHSPFLVGLLRPMIVLPAAIAESGSADELDAVLSHELAHVRRRDLLWNWLPSLAETACWFHPLVWLARREWRVAQEIATDELAVTATHLDIPRYARALVDVVAKSPPPTTTPHLAVALSEAYTQLARRMTAMQTFHPLTRRSLGTFAAVVLAFGIAGLVPWKLTAQDRETPVTQTNARRNNVEAASNPDSVGDSLPEGTVLRLGTTRLRGAGRLAFSADGRQLFSMGGAVPLRAWDVKTGALIRRYQMDDWERVSAAAFSPDGTKLATVRDGGRVRLYDVETGQVLATPLGHRRRAHAVAFSPDGTVFATGGTEPVVAVWDTKTGSEVTHFEGETERGRAQSIAFSPDGRLLACGTQYGVIQIWNLTDGGDPTVIPKAHRSNVVSLAFTPDGSLMSGGANFERLSENRGQQVSEIRIWDAETGEQQGEYPFFRKFLGDCSIVLSHDGSRLVSAHHDEILLWDVQTRRVLQMLKSDGRYYRHVAISPDNKLVAATASDTRIRLWDAESGRELRPDGEGHQAMILAVSVSPDGKTIATGGRDATVRLWDGATGEQLRVLSTCTGAGGFHYAEFFPQGDRIALAGSTFDPDRFVSGGEVKIVQVASGAVLQTFPTTGTVMCGALSPDGSLVAAGIGNDFPEGAFRAGEAPQTRFVIAVWDTRTGQNLQDLEGHERPVADLAFEADGKSLWSVSSDRTVRKWDVTAGKVLSKNTLPDDGQFSRIHGPQLGLRSSRIAFERSWRGDKGEWLHSHEIRSLDNGE